MRLEDIELREQLAYVTGQGGPLAPWVRCQDGRRCRPLPASSAGDSLSASDGFWLGQESTFEDGIGTAVC